MLHGPLVPDKRQHRGHQPPTLNAYPQEWVEAYRRSEPEFLETLCVHTSGRAATERTLDIFSAVLPLRYAERVLRAWEQRSDTGSVPKEKRAA